MILVTGGTGFISSNFVRVDKLAYAANLSNLAILKHDPRHICIRGDIYDTAHISRLLAEHQPRAILHFAAENHVDLSIHIIQPTSTAASACSKQRALTGD
ncbi:dTDP-glucose 4,6-dehydratase [Janthinobacterium sp. MP5059B]|nr:dTDP-glucose 4,6-dehydratase [Janthinobacterium sp. MP5059B]